MVQSVNTPINFKADTIAYPAVSYNNRYTPPMPDNSIDDVFLMQEMANQKAMKKEKAKEKWNKAGVIAQIGIAIGIIGGAIATVFAAKTGAKALQGAKEGSQKLIDTLKPVDVSKEKTFEELTLGPEMKKVVEDVKTRIERADALRKKGSKGGSGIMLYGEPGGGKNAYVYALTKYMQEKFPGSELYEMNVLKLTDKYVGETENNIMGFVEQMVELAKTNPKKKYIVFMDEFDSIARKEDGNNIKMGEKFQNAFKTTLTKLTSCDNIQVIAATNKAEKDAALNKVLDEAILNRFPQKVFIPLPSKDQLKNAVVAHYKSLPQDVVDKELTDINSSKLDSVCRDIAKKSNHASFRDLQYIFEHARVISESGTRKEGSPITINDLKEAVKKHADSNNWGKGVTRSSSNDDTSTSIGSSILEKITQFFSRFRK